MPDLTGSLGGGGRYDNLVGMFLGRDVPACGFSLGLERIIVVMTERNMFPAKVSRGAVDVMIAVLDESLRADALKLAAELQGREAARRYLSRRRIEARQAAQVRVESQRAGPGDRRRGRACARGSRGEGSADAAAGQRAARAVPPNAIAKRVRIGTVNRMTEHLGNLVRTHTCGALRIRRRRQGCDAARLGAPRPRSGRRALHRHPRSRRRVAGRRARR